MQIDNDKLKRMIAVRNMTYKECSLKAGLGSNYFPNMFKKNNSPRLRTILSIAKALDCDPEQICKD